MVGGGCNVATPPSICGYWFSLSDDLVNWEEPHFLRPTDFDITPSFAGEAYASVIDHDDGTINFEKADQSFYLYFVRVYQNVLDRKLIRIPVTIEKVYLQSAGTQLVK